MNCHSYSHVYLKRGVIKKQTCALCGSSAQMHHPDYDKPIRIIWLCRKHHLNLHTDKKLRMTVEKDETNYAKLHFKRGYKGNHLKSTW